MATGIDSEASRRPLYCIFTKIPERYDLINHVITLGMDAAWRRQAALQCLGTQPERILDLCCGTGDLAITMAELAPYSPEIAGVDFSLPMLYIAASKAAGSAKEKNIKFLLADVSRLPFADGHFDCIGISFAFRNLTYKNPRSESYLDEVLRVLKPGGKFIIVESSQPKSAFIRFFFRLYLRCFVFPAGFLLSGNKGAYRYLSDSAADFYSAEELSKLLLKKGFKNVVAQRLFLGAAAIHVAVK